MNSSRRIVADEHPQSLQTKTRKPSPAKLASLAIGESVRINTRGKGIDGWTGRILALDTTAIRIRTSSYHMTWGCGWLPTNDVDVIPWAQIESSDVLGDGR
jgi:hypothetical protein